MTAFGGAGGAAWGWLSATANGSNKTKLMVAIGFIFIVGVWLNLDRAFIHPRLGSILLARLDTRLAVMPRLPDFSIARFLA